MEKNRKFPSGFLLLCFMGAFAIFSSTMSKSPTLSWFSQFLGANKFEIGLIASASTITGIFVNVTAGSLSDVYGRRKLLLIAGVVFATAPFLYLLVTQTWQLALVRVYHGFATAIFTPVSLASIADLFPSRRGEMMGLFSSSTMIGRLLAPSVAGFLIWLQFLAPFQLAYIICGVSGTIALLASFRLRIKPQKQVEKPKRKSSVINGLRAIARDARILVTSSTEAATYFSIGAVETFMPIYADVLHLEKWETGLIMSLQILTIALTRPLMGAVSDRYGRKAFITLGLLTSAISLVILPFTQDFFALLAMMIVHGLGIAATTSSTSPLISEISSPTLFGSALGALETIKDVGHATGPILTGFLIGQLGYVLAFVMTSTILLADLTVFRLHLRKDR